MTVKITSDHDAYVLQQVTGMGPAYAQYVDYATGSVAPTGIVGTLHGSGFSSAVPSDITLAGTYRVMLCQQSGPNGVLIGGFTQTSTASTLAWTKLISPTGSINFFPLGIEAGHPATGNPYVFAAWALYDTSTYSFTGYTVAKIDATNGTILAQESGPQIAGTYSPPPCNQTYSATSPPSQRVYQQAKKIIYVNNSDTVYLVGRLNTSTGPLAFLSRWSGTGTTTTDVGLTGGASPNWFNAVDGDGVNAYFGGIGWDSHDFPRTYWGSASPTGAASAVLVSPIYSPPYPLNNDECVSLAYSVDPANNHAHVHMASFALGPNLGATNVYSWDFATGYDGIRTGAIPTNTTTYPGGSLMTIDTLHWNDPTYGYNGIDLSGYNPSTSSPLIKGLYDPGLFDVINPILPLTPRSFKGFASDMSGAYPGVFVLSTNTMGNPILLKYN
ncbi:hypothetical protein [Fimbriimonas ginsengisoli]|nr:hypothetical protein [Fimbriimonas ginsengisoli]